MKRLGVRLVIGAIAGCILISCATKHGRPASAPAAATKKKPHASPSPSATPAPTPAPTPEVHYTATVSVEGGEPTQRDITPSASSSPTPTPSPSPTASPKPSPSPKPAPGNFLTNTWRKIFPPKPTPTPAPDLTGTKFRISTSDATDPARLDESASAAVPSPAPTPIMLRNQPAEGFTARMWHKIFPQKKSPPVAAPPQWIGTIKLVNEREGYVLIDASNGLGISTGQTLNSVGSESESGVLRASADRDPPFFIADIVSGKPRPGDRIYSPQP